MATCINYYDRNKNNPAFQEHRRAYLREWRRNNKVKQNAISLKSYHKRKQDLGKTCPVAECPICLKVKKLVWDHDHQTGEFRGWICRQCNIALGLIGDDYSAVRRLMAYLQGTYENY